jgi:hypothetical protein
VLRSGDFGTKRGSAEGRTELQDADTEKGRLQARGMGDFGLTCNDTTGGDAGRQDEEGEGGIHLEHMLGLQREEGGQEGKERDQPFFIVYYSLRL